MRKWWREIMAVGLKDWLWFVVRLRRNEFHRSLDMRPKDLDDGFSNLMQRRQRAHDIDIKLTRSR